MRPARRAIACFANRAATTGIRIAAVALPAIAWAQDSAPPAPSLKRSPAPWVGYMLIFVLLAAVVAVSLLPSKRGHQD